MAARPSVLRPEAAACGWRREFAVVETEGALDQVVSVSIIVWPFGGRLPMKINYRRFFDISDLIGLHAERDEVFRATHAYPLKLVESGKVTGLRIDHIDGLLDPKSYLERLPRGYVVVEKILAGHEQLPCDWQTNGTTGYDFLNFVNGAFIDREGFHQLVKTFSEFTGSAANTTEIFRERKRQVMKELFGGEVNALVHRLFQLAEEDRHARDLARTELHDAFISVTACLPVYRTYSGTSRFQKRTAHT